MPAAHHPMHSQPAPPAQPERAPSASPAASPAPAPGNPVGPLDALRIAVIGFLMGCADLVPGVSGGTIAFVGGIYERLIHGLKSFDLGLVRRLLARDWAGVWRSVPFVFFVCLGAGLLTAIASLAGLVSRLFVTHPVQLWAAFFGLVLGSIVLLARETWRWRPLDWALFAAAAVATYVIVGLPMLAQPPEGLPYLFLCGAIAICAMILPGISGSYLLVILGQYHRVLEAVHSRDFVALGVFVAGIVVGIMSFVRVVSFLLRRFHHATLIALTGVMAGALRTIWPWRETISTRVNSKGVEVPVEQVNVLPPDWSAVPPALLWLAVGVVAVLVLARLRPAPAAAPCK
jgi:putative membrane protein